MSEARRFIVLWISENDFLALLGGWDRYLKSGDYIALPSLQRAKWTESGVLLIIPEDAVMARATHDWHRRAFGIMLEHPEFEPVAPGEEAPSATLTKVLIHGLSVRQDTPDASLIVEVPK